MSFPHTDHIKWSQLKIFSWGREYVMPVFQLKENEKCSKNDPMRMSLTGLIFFVVGTNP